MAQPERLPEIPLQPVIPAVCSKDSALTGRQLRSEAVPHRKLGSGGIEEWRSGSWRAPSWLPECYPLFQISVLSIVHIATMTSQKIHEPFVIRFRHVEQPDKFSVTASSTLKTFTNHVLHVT